MNIGDKLKIDHVFIFLADEKHIIELEQTFFKLHHYAVEYKSICMGSDVSHDLYCYDHNHYSERKADSKVCCSFVPQSDIQYAGIVSETFIPNTDYPLSITTLITRTDPSR